MYLWSFIKKQTSGTSNDNDDDEWYNEWQRMTTSDKTNENEWESVKGVILSFKMKEKANLVPEQFYSIFYLMCKYYMFSNIDNL